MLPLWPHTLGGICYSWFYHTWLITYLWPSLSLYLLDRAGVHEISALMIWFQCMSDIFSHYGDLDLLYIFIFYGDLDPLYIFIMEILIYYILYVAMTTRHILYIMPIHGHCTLMYPGLLYVFAAICRDWLLYYTDGLLVLPPVSSSLHF